VSLAQSGLQVQTQVSSRRVEVGEVFELQLVALTDAAGPPPTAPRLPTPAGFTVNGPNVTSQQQVSISGGAIQQRLGITATWLLTGTRAGVFKLGPPRVSVGGNEVHGEVVEVQIVPRGQGSPGGQRGTSPRSQAPFDPFDPFDFFRQRGLPSFPGFNLPESGESSELDNLPPVPDEYHVDRAPEQTAFLRAVVTPNRAMLGEQMTLRVYAYGRRGPFREANTSEPSKADFLSFSLVDNSQNERLYRVPIAGDIWYAIKIREVALFPIRSGTLKIGAMRMGFDGRGYVTGVAGQTLMRQSPELRVTVTEPPVAKRPAGYELGTVGQYSLNANVEPRETTQGDAVSVIVKLQGIGNLPHKLRTPQQNGVEWLEPTVVEELEPRDGRIQGFRTFSYVVRLTKAGHVELGAITLPYWDPDHRRYEVARAELGALDVKASANAATKAAAQPPDRLRALLVPRAALGAPAARPLHIADRPWFWLALAGGPLAVLVVSGGVSMSRRVSRRFQERTRARQAQASAAMRSAREALARGDEPAAASAIERAVFLAIEGVTGLRARAVLKDHLTRELTLAGLSATLSQETASVLSACDDLRFASGNYPAPELVKRAEKLVGQLAKFGGARRRESSA
jgi:hypothetical protein